MRSIRLCVSACALHLTHDVHHGLNGMCVNSFSQTRNAHMVWGLAPLLPRQEFCRRVYDPQYLVAQMRLHAWTNHMTANFGILQLVRTTFANLQPVRMTLVTLQLVPMSFVKLQFVHTSFVKLQLVRNVLLVRMTLVNLLLVRMISVNLLLVRMNSVTLLLLCVISVTLLLIRMNSVVRTTSVSCLIFGCYARLM